MTILHTFGCSITQGFALPDVVKPAVDETGRVLTDKEVIERKIHWSDIHLYQPSNYAWPQLLANKLNVPVNNYARRGACFQQIARQCAVGVKDIKPGDTVIVMWTYLSRLSLQWPARTSVPFANIANPDNGWQTVILGFNKLFGLERSVKATAETDERIQKYIEDSTKNTYLDPLGVFNRYYNSLVLQTMTDGFLRATGARVIHLSVETEPVLRQLENARRELDDSLKEPYNIPNPADWYKLDVDYDSCYELHNPDIPPAPNDMHPSVTHHQNFAEQIYKEYFL
jgi:hypothetical protein